MINEERQLFTTITSHARVYIHEAVHQRQRTVTNVAKAAQMVWVMMNILVWLLQLHLFHTPIYSFYSILILSVLFVVFVIKLGAKVFMPIFEEFEAILQGTDHQV